MFAKASTISLILLSRNKIRKMYGKLPIVNNNREDADIGLHLSLIHI